MVVFISYSLLWINLLIGLGIIQYSNLIRSKKASESMVGEYVKFHNKNLWFCGVNLSGNTQKLPLILNNQSERNQRLLASGQFVFAPIWTVSFRFSLKQSIYEHM